MPREPQLFPPLDPDTIRRYDVAGPRYTSYPTVPEWTDAFGADAYRAHLERAGRAGPEAPLSLYVHIPFCWAMCRYCGCNVVVSQKQGRADGYLDDLEREMDLVVEALGDRRRVAQLHWGGGTPTFLDPAQTRRLFEAIGRRFELLPDAEIAIEVKPSDTSVEQLELLADLGFNRLSMGVQDFDPRVQEAVGRAQTVAETEALLRSARELGFLGINFDLIYGLPYQSPEGWERTLAEVVRMRPDRVAVYSFAYLPQQRPHQRLLPAEGLPPPAEKLDLFRQAYNRFVRASYRVIGMDHFAVPEDELARGRADGRLWRNFQGYTVRRGTSSVAFGVTGISDVGGAYAQNVRSLKAYHAALSEGHLPIARGLALTDEDTWRRALITDLMCNGRLVLGERIEELRPELERLAHPDVADLVQIDGDRLQLTAIGRIFVRNVAMVFDGRLAARPADQRPTFSRTI